MDYWNELSLYIDDSIMEVQLLMKKDELELKKTFLIIQNAFK